MYMYIDVNIYIYTSAHILCRTIISSEGTPGLDLGDVLPTVC